MVKIHRPHLTLLLLAAGLAIALSQYEDASVQSWQPSRTRRIQNPSLISNPLSSPQSFSAQRNVLPSATAPAEFRPTGGWMQSRTYQQSSLQGDITGGTGNGATEDQATGPGLAYNKPPAYTSGRSRFSSRDASDTSGSGTLTETQGDNIQRTARRGSSLRNIANINRSTDDIARQPTSFGEDEPARRGYSRRTPVSSKSSSVVEQSEDTQTIRSRNRSYQRPTHSSPRTSTAIPTSKESLSRELLPRTGPTSRSFSEQSSRQANSVEVNSEEIKPTNRYFSRGRTTPSAEPAIRKKSSGSAETSSERTLSPMELSPMAPTTEGYKMPSTQVTQKSVTRGRVRAHLNTQTPTTTRPRQLSRGETKARLAVELTPKDASISEEDNYPKEFIDKIRHSEEKDNGAKTNQQSRNRFSRARPPSVQQSLPSIDPDISESTNEEVIDQNVPEAVKSKEISSYTRHRYFGKSRTTTTTEPPTTKSSFQPTQSSNIDLVRQKYKDKLKLSQEERSKKLAIMRAKLTANDNENQSTAVPVLASEVRTSTTRSFTKSSPSPFQPSSRFSRPGKKFEPKSQNEIRTQSRFSPASRQPDPSLEPATPTVADSARYRNRYSRLRKEELSVEAPEAKTFSANLDTPHESTFNFVHLRTKDQTPLASEDVIDSFLNNELDTSVGTSTEPSSSAEAITSTTIKTDSSSMNTAEQTMTEQSPTEFARLDSVRSTASSGEVTSEATTIMRQDPVTSGSIVTTTMAVEALATETVQPSQQSFPSTRHRFSSRYNGSTSSSTISEKFTETSVENELTSTLSALDLSVSPFSSGLSSSTTPAPTTTTLRSISSTKSNVATTKAKASTATDFLNNRPILKSIVSLFTTTTKKPTTKSRPKPKAKPKALKKQPTTTVRTTTTAFPSSTTTTSTTTTENPANNTISPLPLSINAEDVINNTQELIKNKTSPSFGSDFSKVPREELDALTPLSVTNTTEAFEITTLSSTAGSTTEVSSTQAIMSSTEANVTSQPIFFEYSSSRATPTTTRSTTPTTTTAGDYFVYGIYPNNTVVRKRAWKTFDYERYMSPYVIFGIYPNNTIVRKFPNGTVINDEFMTSDNEIGGPSPSSTTSVTTTTIAPLTSPLTSSLAASTTAVVSSTSETTTTPLASEATTTPTASEATTTPSASEITTTPSSSETTTASLISETTTPSASDTMTGQQTEVAVDATTENNEVYDEVEDAIRSAFDVDGNVTESSLSMKLSSGMGTTEPVDVIDVMSGGITDAPTSTPQTSTTLKSGEETTINPAENQVLPLTLQEVQSLWSGNFSDALAERSMTDKTSFGINFPWSENRLPSKQNKTISIANIAFRALSSGTDDDSKLTTLFVDRSTTEETTTAEASTTRRPRVKFVTVAPRFMTTTSQDDVEDSITLPSQHVQRVSKAFTQLPEDVFTNLFGSLEQESSSPIPEILKDVNEVEGDGLTAALARRIIALAMERAKSTTPESTTPTTPFTTTEMTTNPPTTIFFTKPNRKKAAGRAIASSTINEQKNALPTEGDLKNALETEAELKNVLEQLIKAQDTLASSSGLTTVTTMKPAAELEKTVENQIRLAEQVRKASRNMAKKKKKPARPRTTTPRPRPILSFLFNFFNQPDINQKAATPIPARIKVPSSPSPPDSQILLMTSLPSPGTEVDVEDEPVDDNEVQGERQTRSQLLTAAIDVTRAVGKFMGTVMNSAARSFQSFVRTNWGR